MQLSGSISSRTMFIRCMMSVLCSLGVRLGMPLSSSLPFLSLGRHDTVKSPSSRPSTSSLLLDLSVRYLLFHTLEALRMSFRLVPTSMTGDSVRGGLPKSGHLFFFQLDQLFSRSMILRREATNWAPWGGISSSSFQHRSVSFVSSSRAGFLISLLLGGWSDESQRKRRTIMYCTSTCLLKCVSCSSREMSLVLVRNPGK
mmetsp:Transcript_10444/g.25811  ORF Transcript_10444/g.25811 Transcript_10444/m.25811 type:complete len:200 (+) Transcript_10444:192-791(+)